MASSSVQTARWTSASWPWSRSVRSSTGSARALTACTTRLSSRVTAASSASHDVKARPDCCGRCPMRWMMPATLGVLSA
eukprot:6205071-Pleurochrysis_carterae.AAC.3